MMADSIAGSCNWHLHFPLLALVWPCSLQLPACSGDQTRRSWVQFPPWSGFLCPCVGPIPSLELTLTWSMGRKLALYIILYHSIRSKIFALKTGKFFVLLLCIQLWPRQSTRFKALGNWHAGLEAGRSISYEFYYNYLKTFQKMKRFWRVEKITVFDNFAKSKLKLKETYKSKWDSP